MIYTRQNGYGDIDPDAEQFQVGRRLYEAQIIHGKASRGETISPEDVKELAHWYCELVAWTGQLRADYRVMRACAEGKATFREE